MHVWMWCMCRNHENFWKLAVSFMGSKNWTQVIRLMQQVLLSTDRSCRPIHWHLNICLSFYMCVCVYTPTWVCVPSACGSSWRWEDNCSRVTGSCELPCGGWQLHPCLLKEQVLLTIEPSLQPAWHFIHISFIMSKVEMFFSIGHFLFFSCDIPIHKPLKTRAFCGFWVSLNFSVTISWLDCTSLLPGVVCGWHFWWFSFALPAGVWTPLCLPHSLPLPPNMV